MGARKLSVSPPRRRARDRRLVAGVDLGASKAACFIAEIIDEGGGQFGADVIGVGCHGARARIGGGLSVDEMEDSLRRAVDAAERMAGERVNKVHIAAPGRILRARRIGVDLEITDGVVTQEDVDDCLREGAGLAAAPECVGLFSSPIAYRLDGEGMIDDPVGQAGGILSAEMIGLSIRESAAENLAAIVERAGLAVEEIVPSPIAAAANVLLEDEKDLGVILIDIGATSTQYAVYDNGALIDCGGVSLGGAHITKDIAQIFGTPLEDAERIKILNGAALIGSGDEHRLIDFPQLGDGAEVARASRADLCEVIIPRLEEIFEMIAQLIDSNHGARRDLRRAVITGGGSLLLGARELVEKSMSVRARIGRPIAAIGAPEAGAAPGFSVCAGLIVNAANQTANDNFSLGLKRQSPHALGRLKLFGDAGAWLKMKF